MGVGQEFFDIFTITQKKIEELWGNGEVWRIVGAWRGDLAGRRYWVCARAPDEPPMPLAALQSELLEEAEVVFDEGADVGFVEGVDDVVFAHDEAFDAEAEGPAGVEFGVDVDGFEDVGIDHAAAADFHPAGGAVGEVDEDIDLGGGFGEGEEGGADAGLDIRAEVGFGELVDGGAEVDHGDALVDDEGFELVELEEVGGVDGVGAVDAAGGDDADGWLLGLHDADLDGGGLAAEHEGGGAGGAVEVEIVEGVARRVDFGDVEGFEVVEVVFDFGAFGDGEAHAGEEGGEFVDGLGDDVEGAGGVVGELEAAGFGDVDAGDDVFASTFCSTTSGFEGGFLFFVGGGDGGFDFVHALAEAALFGAWEGFEVIGGVFEEAFGAEVFDAEGFEIGRGFGGGEIGGGGGEEIFEIHERRGP
jgi:hypothetical protein